MWNLIIWIETKKRFNEEILKWISNGWLTTCEATSRGFLAMMAVTQVSKRKVRPVIDFRELNEYVESFTGESSVCCDTLRKWRSVAGKLSIIDLRDAYMQLNVSKRLWQYQVVKFDGSFFALMRLGFGLNCAPKIMTEVLKKVLSLDKLIHEATDHYIDDIIVNESIVAVQKVVDHLQIYGLETKPVEAFHDVRVLGLQLTKPVSGGELKWIRGNIVPKVYVETMTRKELFSICGKLIGHYSVCGWLRVACSYIKRHSCGSAWTDDIGDKCLGWIKEVVSRVGECDPVQGVWTAPVSGSIRVWCDASNLSLGVVLKMDGRTVEDAGWMREENDCAHINVSELDAVVQCVNMAIKWNLKNIALVTDSTTVHGWLTSVHANKRHCRNVGQAASYYN